MASGARSGRREPQVRINRRITARTVRLVTEDNEQVGIVEFDDALQRAEDAGLDLVEVAANADPPVVRIMDYGQYKYKQSKKQHEAKKHQKVIQLKEIKLRPKTEEHDFRFKFRHAVEFLEKGNKVKVTVRFRGREMAHQDIGMRLLQRFSEEAEEWAGVESPPKMEGRNMSMVLAPHKK